MDHKDLMNELRSLSLRFCAFIPACSCLVRIWNMHKMRKTCHYSKNRLSWSLLKYSQVLKFHKVVRKLHELRSKCCSAYSAISMVWIEYLSGIRLYFRTWPQVISVRNFIFVFIWYTSDIGLRSGKRYKK